MKVNLMLIDLIHQKECEEIAKKIDTYLTVVTSGIGIMDRIVYPKLKEKLIFTVPDGKFCAMGLGYRTKDFQEALTKKGIPFTLSPQNFL